MDGARYRYVLCGKAGARTLVFLNGGMVAQIYVQKYPGEAGGLILVSTGGRRRGDAQDACQTEIPPCAADAPGT